VSGAERVAAIVRGTPWLMDALRAAREVDAPEWLIGAGAIRTAVWDHLHGFDQATELADVDLVFFDPDDLSRERDEQVEARLRERAAVERLEYRRLDLEETALVEPAAHRGDRLRAQDEQVASLVVGDQVELAVAVARLCVLDSEVFLGHFPQALRQQLPVAHEQGQLTSPGLERSAVHADQVADIQGSQQLEGFAPQDVPLRLDLQLARPVHDVDEGCAPVPAPSRHPAGYPVLGIGLLAWLQPVVLRVDSLDRHDPVELVRKGVDSLLAQALELGPAIVHFADAT